MVLLNRTLSVWLVCAMVVSMWLLPSPPVANAAGNVTIAADLTKLSSETLENKFISTQWYYETDWTTAASGQPSNYFATNYPHTKTVQLMTATGGCYTGYTGCVMNLDLFVDPSNASIKTDYKFDRLLLAVRNVLNQGLTPFIKTGNVPIKYSTNPVISPAFGVNIRPPSDYMDYYRYIKALGDAMVAEFGINTVKTFTWGVLTEATNVEWFHNADGTQASTLVDFLKLYDYTVAALQDSIGASNLTVGTHEFNGIGQSWIDHCVSGTNYKTGGTGTQCNYVSESHYQMAPGGVTPNFTNLTNLKNYAAAQGLNLKIGVDEGEFFNATDGLPLQTRTTGQTAAGSYEALLFKRLNDQGVNWFTKWAQSTRGTWGGANGPVLTADTNVDILAAKMSGDRRATAVTSGTPIDATNIVDGIASFNASANTVHFMAFNHNPDVDKTVTETPTLVINNIKPASGTTVTVKTWYVDDTHAQFWNTWTADANARGLTSSSYDPYWSPYSPILPGMLVNAADIAYYNSRESTYKSLSQLSSTTTTVTPTGNTLVLTPSLKHHGVVFYEITNAQAATILFVDDLNDWSKTYSKSPGLMFDTANSAIFGDSSRVMRTHTNASPAENIVYNVAGAANLTARTLFNTGEEAIVNFLFFTSPDGSTWTQQTGWTNTDTPMAGGTWTQRIYHFSSLPSGTNFFKFQFRTGGVHTYAPQLGQVKINYVQTDDLNNWDKLGNDGSHSPGVVFDTANAVHFADASRATRNNTNTSGAEYVIYNYENPTQLTATSYFNSGEEAIVDYLFYTSPDGVTWTQQTGWTKTDTSMISGIWTKRVYTLSSIPAGTKYVKIQFRTGGTHSYSPQLGQVIIYQ